MDEEDIIETVLQEAWTKLLAARKEGKLPGFDIEVPAQIQSWLSDIYASQLNALRLVDKEAYNLKLFSIAMAYRISIHETVGVAYFMKEMNDEGKMKAIDRLINDIRKNLQDDLKTKRSLR